MGDILSIGNNGANEVREEYVEPMEDVDSRTEAMLKDLLEGTEDANKTRRIPYTQIAALGGAGAAAANAVQKAILDKDALYRVINAEAGDALKYSNKGGFFWGALKKESGKSAMAKLQKATPETFQVDPAAIMIAVALVGIQANLTSISETQKQILEFLENEKESEIRGDVQTLEKIVSDYRYNWDNELFVANNHKLVIDIRRTAEIHLNSFRNEIEGLLKPVPFFVTQQRADEEQNALVKKFKYYRLSMYTYALASLLEVLLGDNRHADYILKTRDDIQQRTYPYSDLFAKGLEHMAHLASKALEMSIRSHVGAAGKGLGKAIGSIPLVKRGPVDEFLKEKGEGLLKRADDSRDAILDDYYSVEDPGVRPVIERLNELAEIYGETKLIYLDKDGVKLVAG